VNASTVLAAIRRHHHTAAIVPEVCIQDDHDVWEESFEKTTGVWTRRIDALMFKSLERTAIEIKTSVADAKRDTWQKVYPWKRCVHRFVYACPAGLLDVPPYPGCGLWWVFEDGHVEVKRKAKVNITPEPLPQRTVQNIAYRAASCKGGALCCRCGGGHD
jgi:hypothetical protein